MVLKYYYDLMSQPCRTVYMFLELNRIPYERHVIALRKGEHMREPFSKINPLQKVPVIDDDGFILTESIAILEYLSKKYKVAEHWYPHTDLKRQARVDEYTQFHHTNTRLHVASLFREILMIPSQTGKPVNKDEVAKWEYMVRKVITYLDTYFLKDRKFLCGDEISIADILCICELTQLKPVGKEDLYLSNNNVRQWSERVQGICGRVWDEAHTSIDFVTKRLREQQKAAAKM